MKILSRLLAVFLCLFALQADASHHRKHAADRMDFASNRYVRHIITSTNRYRSVCELDEVSERNISVVEGYSEKLLVYLPQWRKRLLDNGNLDDVRRAMSQPAIGGGQSILAILAATIQHAKRQIGYCPAGSQHLQNIITRAVSAWGLLDQAAWHIGDAIREEIYQDPAFICAGPNNHCE